MFPPGIFYAMSGFYKQDVFGNAAVRVIGACLRGIYLDPYAERGNI
jgi:hypothetical protein